MPEENKPLGEEEQKQLTEIMQIFMQLPNRDKLSIKFYADASGSLYNTGASIGALIGHFHDLEEGVTLLRWYANPDNE